ncbi:glycosyltransferase family 34 protein [Rhizodiscina lignyota]|uniref:Glycosyltransferase family 34 protein n=1 Tax=Rhizodiscina lignyota TaxID=1504668 RepID=A0A9P4II74_9PEZI|nr:glycosyltransferase family 34 protein [Rhizodiscina lignyota]
MHFAYPPRKSSNPPPYFPKGSRSPFLRRNRLQTIALCAVGGFLLFFLVSKLFGSSPESIPSGTPPVVLVTVIEPERSHELSDKIKENRRQYAELHGYATFFANNTDYDLDKSPKSWSRVPAMRHAMTEYPHSTFFFYLDENALITNHEVDLIDDIMEKSKLESLMRTNIPVVPPDSVIKTFAHLKGDRIDLVLTQDKEGLAHDSFIMRRGDWAKYFLDAWFDPLYRSYNFQKAEAHALEHLVQWHGTILAKLALVKQNVMNSYADPIREQASDAGAAREGDFVTYFGLCDNPPRNCENEMQPYIDKATRQYNKMN